MFLRRDTQAGDRQGGDTTEYSLRGLPKKATTEGPGELLRRAKVLRAGGQEGLIEARVEHSPVTDSHSVLAPSHGARSRKSSRTSFPCLPSPSIHLSVCLSHPSLPLLVPYLGVHPWSHLKDCHLCFSHLPLPFSQTMVLVLRSGDHVSSQLKHLGD